MESMDQFLTKEDLYKARSERLEAENSTLQEENRRLELNYDLCLEEGEDRISTLQEENKKLREALGDIIFHCIDFNHGAESFVLAMEIEKARKALETR